LTRRKPTSVYRADRVDGQKWWVTSQLDS